MADKARFNWEDPLLIDHQLTEEERMVRDSAQQIAPTSWHPACCKRFAMSVRTPRFSVKWANWACWARPFPSNTAAPA